MTGCAARWSPRVLDDIIRRGRFGFYGGRFGDGLLALGAGLFTRGDLEHPLAQWDWPLRALAWDREIWTVPPPSQGYLSLAGARIADGLELPDDPDDPSWAHLLAEAARWAGHDRDAVLFDGADGADLLTDERLDARRAAIDPDRRTGPTVPAAGGGTIHLCVVDRDGMGVSLIQSNAAGWGAHLVVPGTGIFLQNRGIGFSLAPGHPGRTGPWSAPAAHPGAGAGHRRSRIGGRAGHPGRRPAAAGGAAIAGQDPAQRADTRRSGARPAVEPG